MRQTVYSNVNIVLSTTEIYYTSKYTIFIFSVDISGSQDGSIRMWEFGHSQEITSHHTSGSYQRVTRARFSPHGNKVILMLY